MNISIISKWKSGGLTLSALYLSFVFQHSARFAEVTEIQDVRDDRQYQNDDRDDRRDRGDGRLIHKQLENMT